MEAGRKLDALIAEKVMGWVPYESDLTEGWSTQAGELRVWATSFKEDNRAELLWRPSVNIAAALEVAEKIHDIQPRFVLEAQPFVRPRVWWCSVYGHDRVEASTAPLAICLAALKYLEINEITK